MGRMEDDASFWEIERLLLGEIQGAEAEDLRRRIAASPKLSAYMARVQAEAPSRSFRDLESLAIERRHKEEASRPEKFRPEKFRVESPSRSIWSRIGDWTGTIAPPRSRPVFALAMTLMVGFGLWRFMPGTDTASGAVYQEKGGEGFEVLLRIGSRDLEQGETGLAKESDTLSFSYRSSGPRHVQVWYQEDEGALQPFPGREGPSLAWPAATRWTQPSQKILLKGLWKKQSVWVVASEAELSSAEVKAAILGERGSTSHANVVQFRMKHPE